MNTMETVKFDEAMFEIRKLFVLHESNPYSKEDALIRFAQIAAYAAKPVVETLELEFPDLWIMSPKDADVIGLLTTGNYGGISEKAVFINTTGQVHGNPLLLPRVPRSTSPDVYPYNVNVIKSEGGTLVSCGSNLLSGKKIGDFIIEATIEKYNKLKSDPGFAEILGHVLRSKFFQEFTS